MTLAIGPDCCFAAKHRSSFATMFQQRFRRSEHCPLACGSRPEDTVKLMCAAPYRAGICARRRNSWTQSAYDYRAQVQNRYFETYISARPEKLAELRPGRPGQRMQSNSIRCSRSRGAQTSGGASELVRARCVMKIIYSRARRRSRSEESAERCPCMVLAGAQFDRTGILLMNNRNGFSSLF